MEPFSNLLPCYLCSSMETALVIMPRRKLGEYSASLCCKFFSPPKERCIVVISGYSKESEYDAVLKAINRWNEKSEEAKKGEKIEHM